MYFPSSIFVCGVGLVRNRVDELFVDPVCCACDPSVHLSVPFIGSICVVCPCQLFCSAWLCCLEEVYKYIKTYNHPEHRFR